MAYIGKSPTGTGVRQRYYFTATGGETSLSGADDNGLTLSYSDGAYVDVLLNGIELVAGTDYNTNTANTIAGLSALAASDIVTVTVYDIFTVADTVSAKDGGTFSGNVNMNGNLTVDGGTIKLDGNYPVGTGNVALGDTALDSNVSGGSNTAIGGDALTANTASQNTAVGYQAGYSNTTGTENNALGYQSLYSNTTGNQNNAFGRTALTANTTGGHNSAFGHSSLKTNTTGQYNTAYGSQALFSNTTASYNTAVGYQAGANQVNGDHNTYIGRVAGYSGTSGTFNTFVGNGAGYFVSSGGKNTILGSYNGNQGGLDIRTSSNNIVLSDGDGNPRANCNDDGKWEFTSTVDDSTATFYRQRSTSGGSITAHYSDYTATKKLVAFLTTDGSNYNLSGSYGSISDERLKQDIVSASSQWDDIKAVQVKNYRLTSSVEGLGEEAPTMLGVVAQELEASGMDGLVSEGEDGYKTVKYSILYMKAVKALQEAMDRIETLEAKVQTLENA